MTTRAERRAQRAAIKARRIRRIWWLHGPTWPAGSSHIGIAIDTPKSCSCAMCGNPRTYYGDRTIQERRHDWI
jgi:hypothetical protein